MLFWIEHNSVEEQTVLIDYTAPHSPPMTDRRHQGTDVTYFVDALSIKTIMMNIDTFYSNNKIYFLVDITSF